LFQGTEVATKIKDEERGGKATIHIIGKYLEKLHALFTQADTSYLTNDRPTSLSSTLIVTLRDPVTCALIKAF
jgi:hypothetical protein